MDLLEEEPKILISYMLNLSCPPVIYMEIQSRWLEIPTHVELKKESEMEIKT